MASPVDSGESTRCDDDNSNGGPTCIFSDFSDVNDFCQQALKAVLQATKGSNGLPVGDDYEFYSTFRSVRDVMDIEGRRILTLIQKILRHQNVKGNLLHGGKADIEDKFDMLMDVNDQILERVSTSLDEASGVRKEEKKLVVAATSYVSSKTATSWNKKPASDSSKPAAAYRLLTARNIQRPQLSFKDKIDNSSSPYRPLIREKPHAIVPLEESLQLPAGVTVDEAESPGFIHPHPYRVELDRFRPSQEQLIKVTPQEPQPVGLTPLIMVDTLKQLNDLIAYLKTQKEFAVDLEAHSYRSFQGMTCLMQISTRSHDYIVDTQELRSELYQLNEVFTNPAITKVLHGADSDIIWLQRDLGVYVVNMFDTGQAARVLGFSRFSLAHLMMSYCQIEPNKQFQLADWRIRPLPSELINYAREDTHYLLYIWDMMRNTLIDRGNEQANLLMSVYDRSRLVSLKVFQKPVFSDSDHIELYKKSKKTFNNQQMTALKELFFWRDKMARMEDEGIGYVLPNHMLLQIAEILPRERQGVLACCNPVPPLVRQSLPEMHSIILQARELELVKVEKKLNLPSAVEHPKYDSDSILNCPHDLSRLDERLGQIEQKIAATGIVAASSSMFGENNSVMLKSAPTISAFQKLNRNLNRNQTARTLATQVKKLFTSPFVKFVHDDSRSIKKVQPELKERWRMKPQTGEKRKHEDIKEENVNLDTFEPEFIPPTKRTKNVTFQNTQSTPSQSSAPQSSSAPSLFKTPANLKGPESNPFSSNIQSEKKVEKQIRSLRQEVTMKKKKDKIKEKKQKIKREEKEKALMDDTSTPNIEITVANTKPTSEDSSVPVKSVKIVESSLESNQTEEKRLKKKKKKKLTIADVEQQFSTFDYSSAEAKLTKEKSKKTDVYDSKLPSRGGKMGKKERVKRTKQSGPKSNKSITCGRQGKNE